MNFKSLEPYLCENFITMPLANDGRFCPQVNIFQTFKELPDEFKTSGELEKDFCKDVTVNFRFRIVGNYTIVYFKIFSGKDNLVDLLYCAQRIVNKYSRFSQLQAVKLNDNNASNTK